MGAFSHTVEVLDLAETQSARIEALVDTGASFSLIPRSLLRRLGISPTRTAEFTLADGRVVQRDIGNAVFRADGQQTITTIVFGDDDNQFLLGAHALEGLLLSVDPARKRLVPTRGLLM